MTPRPTKAEIELIGEVPLFSLTGKKQLQRIAKEFKLRKAPEGEQITEQGEYGREFYVIVSGSARCEVDGREICTFGRGAFFGELSLIAGGPRSATMIAATPMELLVLDRSDFTVLLHSEPEVAMKILKVVATRLQGADRQVTN